MSRRVRHGLRFRISVAFALMGLVLSASFALAVSYLFNGIERGYIDQTLRHNLDLIVAERRGNPGFPLPYTKSMRGLAYGKNSGAAPAEVAGLAPGLHQVTRAGSELHIAVTDDGDTRYALLYDVSELEHFESELEVGLAVGVVVFSYFALWLGFWMSGRVIEPVSRLVEQIDAAGEQIEGTHLSGPWPHDEVGALARAFDRYASRLRGFLRREQAFTSDVSHELRNPIMSASSTVDLLASKDGLCERDRTALARLRRSIDRMSELVTMFLELAREPDPRAWKTDSAGFALEPVLRAVLARYAPISERKGLAIELNITDIEPVHGAPVAASVVLDNIVGNAIRHTMAGRVAIEARESVITVSDSGPGIPENEMPHIFDRRFRGAGSADDGFGFGLGIVQRVCTSQGWRVTVAGNPRGGTIATVEFAKR